MRKNTSGFTIVELLIVIVVIGILAAITLVAYNGIQQRARDTIRRNDLVQLKKSLMMYNIDKGDYAETGCGGDFGGIGSGWLHVDYDGAGSNVSINSCLMNNKYLSKELVDPTGVKNCGGSSCHAYMKASCPSGTFVYAHLDELPQTANDLNSTCTPSWDTDYGMNYFLKVN